MATAVTVNPVDPSKVEENRDGRKSEVRDSETNIGKTLLEGNGFRVIKKIGSGSYSKVKLAYSEDQKTMVAIKVVSKYHVPDEFLRKFLYNEIKVVKFLKHENIMKYYQSIESSHRLYVIMQYCENGSILDLIQKEKRLHEARACHLFRQILAAIEYCHSQGVCHRDIKCENILLDVTNTVKLIDFGFAKCYKPTPKSTGQERMEAILADRTNTGHDRTAQGTSSGTSSSSSSSSRKKDPKLSETYCGSYAYASPEILKGIPYDPFLADIWAMGCVLYAMVFGRLPFDDRDPAKLIKQVQQPVTFPSSVHASDNCKDCIRKILSPLKSRYTVKDLKNDAWVNTAHMDSQSMPVRARQLSTR